MRFIVTLAATLAVSTAAYADQSGLDSLHSKTRVGGKVCFTDHTHYGTGMGSTKKKAMAAAVSSWSSFTALEYGTDWARFHRAWNKKSGCSKLLRSYTCDVSARPCL